MAGLAYQLLRIVRSGIPRDYSRAAGKKPRAIRYAMTGAMNPVKKESAVHHWPTYLAGVLYHLGTFLSIGLYFVILTGNEPGRAAASGLGGALFLSSAAGFGILLKRMIKPAMRHLSIADDYLSNMLVSLFQLITGLMLAGAGNEIIYYLITSILCLYLPLGKLRHCILFFAARYHLARFYGHRGVWPPPASAWTSHD